MIFLFLDGVGIGNPDDTNPFFSAESKFLPFITNKLILPDDTPVKPIDPTLGVEGLPQSASGQTSLYTGENIPALLERHLGSYPNRLMRSVIKEKNILLFLKKNGLAAIFLNAYPVYYHYFNGNQINIHDDGKMTFLESFPHNYRRHISVTTCMMVSCKQRPFNEDDILAHRSIYQDYTNQSLIERGLSLPEYSPETAAEILYQASQNVDFILYEYFQTDIYAHRKPYQERVILIQKLDRFINKLLSQMDPGTDTLLLTSDHGNLEDSTTRGHTRNPVPLVTWGYQCDSLRDQVNRITDVAPAIKRYFKI